MCTRDTTSARAPILVSMEGPKRGPFRGIHCTDLRLLRIQKGSYVVAPTGRRL